MRHFFQKTFSERQKRFIDYPVVNWQKNEVTKLPLDADIFDVPIRVDILHRVVRWSLANKRQGTASKKTRSEVNYSTKKLRKQKGRQKSC